jgi:hypothetical protein
VASAVAFVPEGDRLVLGYQDGGLELWRPGEEQPRFTFAGQNGAVLALAFHPAGHRFVSSSAGRSIRMWDLEHGHEVLTFTGQLGSVCRLAFDSAGDTLLSVVPRHALVLFEIGTEAERVVGSLAQDLILDENIRTALTKHSHLAAPARAAALDLVGRRPVDAQLLFRSSFEIACEPGHERVEYERARRQAQLASDRHPEDGSMLTALGLARFRLGDLAGARATLTRANELNERRYRSSVPIDLAVMAMCDAALGDAAHARERCAELEPLLRRLPWRDDIRCAGLCDEARRTVSGMPRR